MCTYPAHACFMLLQPSAFLTQILRKVHPIKGILESTQFIKVRVMAKKEEKHKLYLITRSGIMLSSIEI